jgi:hypothetical protein
MKFDILVDGRKMGTATVRVEVDSQLQQRHAVSESAVLKALKSEASNKWYCMGDVEVRPQPATR